MAKRKINKTVAPHGSVRRCAACGIYHTPSVHRSHGRGSAKKRLGESYRVDYPKGKARKRKVKVVY